MDLNYTFAKLCCMILRLSCMLYTNLSYCASLLQMLDVDQLLQAAACQASACRWRRRRLADPGTNVGVGLHGSERASPSSASGVTFVFFPAIASCLRFASKPDCQRLMNFPTNELICLRQAPTM